MSRRYLGAWTACVAIALWCVYRIATFTPQPLDSPGTLRPVLYRWLMSFQGGASHPERAVAQWNAICFAALLVPPALAVLNYLRTRGAARLPGWVCSRMLLFSAIAVCLFVCRYPALLAYELNPDEGQFIASSHKLFADSNFFRSVDCGTSGPLNIYPLMLPAVLGLSPDYASSRVIALLLEFLSIYLLYRTVALIAPDDLARIAILPAAGAFAVFRHHNLVHYSSEHVPLLLVSIALYLATRVLCNPARFQVPVFLLGLTACAAFFTKMQAVPIVAALAGMAVGYVWVAQRGIPWPAALWLLAGAAPLAIANAVLSLTAGVWGDFWMSYIVTNRRYADIPVPFIQQLRAFVAYPFDTAEVRFFLELFFALVVVFLFESWRRRTKSGNGPVQWFGLMAVVSIGAALFSIYQAHRPFPHYLLFLYIPVCATMAWMLLRQEGSAPFVMIFVALTFTYQTYLWIPQDRYFFQSIPSTIRPPEGDYIRSLTSAGGQIAVWGWTVAPYLGSGRVPATRDTNMANFFRWPDISAYYRDRFLRDLRENPAELFVDAVGPTSWDMQDRKRFRFEQFPEIDSYIKANYAHLIDRFGQRYFVRR
jgi:hypothetical protein